MKLWSDDNTLIYLTKSVWYLLSSVFIIVPYFDVSVMCAFYFSILWECNTILVFSIGGYNLVFVKLSDIITYSLTI